MAAPVWVLSVDLQAKTATFQTGMADAAKSARGSFTEIKSGATEMGGHVSSNMFASRHAIMAVSESLGTQMPRAITALLVHIGPLGAALEAAFPFAAIGLAAVLLIEHFEEMKAAGIKLTEDQTNFGTAANNAFNALNQKLTQAAIKSDELRNDHVGALKHELELINMQSMDELAHTFGELAKAADVVFADLKSHWYAFGIGAEGAKHAAEEFQVQYKSLLSLGEDKEASDLLKGTRESAEKVLALQKQAAATGGYSGVAAGGHMDNDQQNKLEAARNGLKAAGVGWTEKEIKAQEILVQLLRDQGTVEGKVANLKKVDSGNAAASTERAKAALRAEGERQSAEHSTKMAELYLSVERDQANAGLAIRNASVMERLLVDMHLADKERDIQLSGNAALQAALDKGGKDYNNQLAGLRGKAEEIEAQHGVNIAGLTTKAQEEANRLALSNLEQSEREQIDATDQGSKERLAAIDAALRQEETKGLQLTAFYRELLTQRVQTQREADNEAAKQSAEAGKIDAENEQRMGELRLSASQEAQALIDSARRMTIQQRIAEELDASNAEFALKQKEMQREAATLDKGGKDYQNKLKEQQNKERQLIQQHENEVTAIKNQAVIERNNKIQAAEQKYEDTIASGLTQVLMGQKSFASVMRSIGGEVESDLLQMAIKHIETNLMTKQSDAAKAARLGFNAGMELGGPIGPVLGPVFAAAAFTAVMAFAGGTDSVPGVGRGDVVPAMLTPGEGVVPGGVMDGLRSMARSGTMGGGPSYHAHVAPVYHLQAIDTTGVEKMLNKHSDTLVKHVETTLRKLNR